MDVSEIPEDSGSFHDTVLAVLRTSATSATKDSESFQIFYFLERHLITGKIFKALTAAGPVAFVAPTSTDSVY